MDLAMTVPWMEEEFQATIRSGLGLFELRLPYKGKRDETILGPFDVRVQEEVDAQNRSRFRFDWRTSGDANIYYKVDSKGNGLAWLVDDPWWMNRIFLMDNPIYLNVANLHTKTGIIPGSVVLQEIQVIRDRLKEWKPIFDVYRNGKKWGWSYTEEEAKQMIKDARLIQPTFDQETGQMVATKSDSNKFEIKQGKVLEYRPEIVELIKMYRREQYGWTSCPEFSREIKPKLMESIKKLRENAATESVSVPADQLAVIREQLKRELLAELRGEIAEENTPASPASGSVEEVQSPSAPNQNDKAFNRHGLLRMKEGNLSNVLASRGIATDGMNKADMIDAILKSNPKNVEEVA